MPKLGAVPPAPEPLDPFKHQAPPQLGVVPTSEVTVAAPPPDQKLGVSTKPPSPVFSVGMRPPEAIGIAAPVITPAPAPLPAPPPVGIAETEPAALYAPPQAPQPVLGAVKDVSITPPPPPTDEEPLPLSPVAVQPVVIDPFKKD